MWRFISENHFVRESEAGIIEVLQYADHSWGWRANHVADGIDEYWFEEEEGFDSAAHAMAAADRAEAKGGRTVKKLERWQPVGP